MAKTEKLTVLCEKPNLAKEVAEALGELNGVSATKQGHYWSVGDSAVTWQFGHMLEQAPPEAYDPKWKSRSANLLPVHVADGKWKLVVPDPSNEKDQEKKDWATRKNAHLLKIYGLLKNAETIVNCGDADREGQLLVDEVILESGHDPFAGNVMRLWITAMDRKSIKGFISDMKPNKERFNLYSAALCRGRADWSWGVNMSRHYTAAATRSGADINVPIGRIMTPTERIVVDRDRMRLNFKPVSHFRPQISFQHANGTFAASWVIPADNDGLDPDGLLTDKKVAEALIARIEGKTAKIASYKAEIKTKAPPLPYSLNALQTACGSKLGLTAQETLDVAQKLYDIYKVSSYPRSDVQHLPTSMLAEVPSIMKALQATDEVGDHASAADLSLRSAAWNDSKVEGHYGIVPTAAFSADKLGRMDATERAVFFMIAKAFVAQFHPNHKWRALSADVSCEGERFKASGRQVVERGWKVVYGDAPDDDEEKGEAPQTLPTMAQGDPVKASVGDLKPDTTKPPAAFTDGTLIEAMANAHKFEPDPDIKKQLRETGGIGTDATRASTIEKLVRIGMLKRGEKKKSQLESTMFGRSVTDAVPGEVSSLGITALWEGMLSDIEAGRMEPSVFMERLRVSIADRIEAEKDESIEIKGLKKVSPIEGHGDKCPACGTGTMFTKEVRQGDHKGKPYLSCSNFPECKQSLWPQARVKPLPGHGKDCPKCGKGKLNTREITSKKDQKKYRLLACTNYPTCKHGEWPEPDVAPLPGHGKACPVCGDGKLNTREVTSKKDGKKYRLLACTGYPACKHEEWPDRPDGGSASKYSGPLLPGDGKSCPECKVGHLKTKEITKKDGTKTKLLSCDNYPACRHGEWPDRGGDKGSKK